MRETQKIISKLLSPDCKECLTASTALGGKGDFTSFEGWKKSRNDNVRPNRTSLENTRDRNSMGEEEEKKLRDTCVADRGARRKSPRPKKHRVDHLILKTKNTFLTVVSSRHG